MPTREGRLAACLDVAWCESQIVPAASAEGTGHSSIAWETGLSSRHLLAGPPLCKEFGQIRRPHGSGRFNEAARNAVSPSTALAFPPPARRSRIPVSPLALLSLSPDGLRSRG